MGGFPEIENALPKLKELRETKRKISSPSYYFENKRFKNEDGSFVERTHVRCAICGAFYFTDSFDENSGFKGTNDETDDLLSKSVFESKNNCHNLSTCFVCGKRYCTFPDTMEPCGRTVVVVSCERASEGNDVENGQRCDRDRDFDRGTGNDEKNEKRCFFCSTGLEPSRRVFSGGERKTGPKNSLRSATVAEKKVVSSTPRKGRNAKKPVVRRATTKKTGDVSKRVVEMDSDSEDVQVECEDDADYEEKSDASYVSSSYDEDFEENDDLRVKR